MRRSAAEFLLRGPLQQQQLPAAVAAGLATRLAALDDAIASAAAEARELSQTPPPALPRSHVGWWVFAAQRPDNAC